MRGGDWAAEWVEGADWARNWCSCEVADRTREGDPVEAAEWARGAKLLGAGPSKDGVEALVNRGSHSEVLVSAEGTSWLGFLNGKQFSSKRTCRET